MFATAVLVGLTALTSRGAAAATSPAKARRPAISTVTPMIPTGSPQPPASCRYTYPTKAWPPKADAPAKARALTLAQVPAGMQSFPPVHAVNGPNLDQLSGGFPRLPIAEVSYGNRANQGSGVDEVVGRAPTAAKAAAAYRFARDVIYGSCLTYFDEGGPGEAPYPLSNHPEDVVAYDDLSGSSYSSAASVLVLGVRGRYVFDMRIDNFINYPATGVATTPTPNEVSAIVTAALERLTG